MSLSDYARNVYAPVQFVDLDLVFIVIDSSGRVAASSSPDTTATHAGSGVYNLTFPKRVGGAILSCKNVGLAAATDNVVSAFDADAGTMSFTVTGGAAVASGDEVHVVIALFGA